MTYQILLLPVQAGKPWNGATLLMEPLGGSESAVAYLARAFAKKGHSTTVVTHGDPGVFDGVLYQPNSEIKNLIQRKWDVIISSRWVEILEHPWEARFRLFWTHDLPYKLDLSIKADKVVTLSEFQTYRWQFTPGASYIIGNGVDLSIFAGPELERNENVLVWTSNPDRGLALAAKIFQELRKRWPDLELHVYGRAAVYGWGPEAEAPYLPRRMHQENVFPHEPLNKSGLAKVLREAWAWFYPTYWPETYCIAALEAQAAGTPVIAPPFGALTETVAGGILTYDYLNAVSQLRNKSKWQKVSEAGKEFASTRDWSAIADQWLTIITEGIAAKEMFHAGSPV